MEPKIEWPPAPIAPEGDASQANTPQDVNDGQALLWSSSPPPGAQPDGPDRQSWVRRRFGPIAAALVALLAKLKAVLLLLPKIKLFSTAGTMAVSLAAYAVLWGWQFAAGFIVLLFVHEMGH